MLEFINGKALNGDPPLDKAAAAELLKTPKRPIILKVAKAWSDEAEEQPSQTEPPPSAAASLFPASDSSASVPTLRPPARKPGPKREVSKKSSGSSGGTKAKEPSQEDADPKAELKAKLAKVSASLLKANQARDVPRIKALMKERQEIQAALNDDGSGAGGGGGGGGAASAVVDQPKGRTSRETLKKSNRTKSAEAGLRSSTSSLRSSRGSRSPALSNDALLTGPPGDSQTPRAKF